MRAARSSSLWTSRKPPALIDDLWLRPASRRSPISLMHAYANPEHERWLRDIVAERYPDHSGVVVVRDPFQFREYDRAITTAMNDYVRPIMKRYLSRIEASAAARACESQAPHRAVGRRSHGAPPQFPSVRCNTVLSGPAGGVTSTVMIARRTGFKKLLAFDMGGTSTGTSRSFWTASRRFSRSTEAGYFPAKVPTLDVRSVGAGGGSIAEVSDLTKSLRVGPRSAGAEPGPVAYGLGIEPTVSDANVVLGYLPPVLLGGDMAPRRGRCQNGNCQGVW